jgi:2'-5' RNA ligase
MSQNRSGHFGEEINLVLLLINERRLLGSLARSLVTVPPELFRLPEHRELKGHITVGRKWGIINKYFSYHPWESFLWP